jgi:hypothetical protein
MKQYVKITAVTVSDYCDIYNTVPTTYFGVVIITDAVFNNGNYEVYLKGISLPCLCF